MVNQQWLLIIPHPESAALNANQAVSQQSDEWNGSGRLLPSSSHCIVYRRRHWTRPNVLGEDAPVPALRAPSHCLHPPDRRWNMWWPSMCRQHNPSLWDRSARSLGLGLRLPLGHLSRSPRHCVHLMALPQDRCVPGSYLSCASLWAPWSGLLPQDRTASRASLRG